MRFSKDSLRSRQRESHGEPQGGLEVRRFGGSEVRTCEPPGNLQSLLRKDSLMIPREFPGGLLDIP
eukprot:11285521-Karenia_brevis.AAC.1